MRTTHWTDWQPIEGLSPLAPHVFAEILDGGQSFRWNRIAEAAPRLVYQGLWSANIAQLMLGPANRIQWRAPSAISAAVGHELRNYLALETDFRAHTWRLPARTNPALASAITAFRGLRILRQSFGETLLGFICSATKQIPQIKQMIALLAERHGSIILSGTEHKRLPNWTELATLTEAELRACKLGFRARHIFGAARYIAASGGQRWLDETENAPCPAAKARLVELPGVGEKVADCVLLFGAGRLEAFPVDTWIHRALHEHYPHAVTEKMNNTQLAQFARGHFGPAAGLANAYFFAHARASARSMRTHK